MKLLFCLFYCVDVDYLGTGLEALLEELYCILIGWLLVG